MANAWCSPLPKASPCSTLTLLAVQLVVEGRVRVIVSGHKTPSRLLHEGRFALLHQHRQQGHSYSAKLPPGASVSAVNADRDTRCWNLHRRWQLACRAKQFTAGPSPRPASEQGPDDGGTPRRSLTSRLIYARSKKRNPPPHPSQHRWVNHLLFSPTDPNLLMYCHEGPWQKVDRIWTIHADGSQNTLIHKRTMEMEIAGHEFWSQDGRTVWYDLQTPKGEDFWLAGV